MAQLNIQPNFSSHHHLTVHEFEPHIGLCADSLEPGSCFRFCVTLSLCPSPTCSLSLSLSKINKHFKIKKKLLYHIKKSIGADGKSHYIVLPLAIPLDDYPYLSSSNCQDFVQSSPSADNLASVLHYENTRN